MKKILLSILIIFLFFGCTSSCHLEKEKTHKMATPFIEKIANYVKQNGIPQNLNNFKFITSCAEKQDIKECKNVKNKYFFTYKNEIYTVKPYWGAYSSGFGLMVQYHDTICSYEIYHDKFNSNYLKPTCSLIPKCNGWGQ